MVYFVFDVYMFLIPSTASANPADEKGLELTPAKDDDPDGYKTLTAPDALERAAKFLNPLIAVVKNNFDAWIATYDVAVRRSKSNIY